MARDPKVLRKAYEAKLGKKLADQLTNEQIGLISKYYNSLSDAESSALDSKIIQGRNNTELHEMAESLIAEKKDSGGGGTLSVYKPDDKFVDDIVEKAEEKQKQELEKTSDKIMDAIDELIAADKQKFEDFKKQQQEAIEKKFSEDVDKKIQDYQVEQRKKEILGKQYDKPIGPQAMQGPKEPPKKTFSPENDEDWEGEVEDQLGSKLDDVLEQVRNEPLPQPAKTKRRKTKGKKVLQRKSARIDAKEMGVGASLSEIMKNVVETRVALFDLYKVTKARFEFKKKIDKNLTASLQAKLREKQIEKPSGSDENLKPGEEKEGKKKKKNVIKEGLIASLVGGAVMVALPLVIEGLRPFIMRDRENEGDNQWWDFLDLFPNEIKKDLDEEAELKPAEEEEQAPAPQPTEPVDDSPENESTPTRSPSGSEAPTPAPQTRPTPVAPIPARDTNIPGDSGYKGPSMPMRAAAQGGKFTGGQHRPLAPLSQKPKKSSLVAKLTKPLSSVVTLPQKAAAAGVLSFANSIISPFSAFLPESGRQFMQNVYNDVAKSSGLSGMKLEMGKSSDIFGKIKKFIDDILKSLLGTSDDPSPDPGEYYGPGFGPGPGGGMTDPTISGDEEEYLMRLMIAEAGGEDELGMAAVGRSVLNRAGLIQSGEVGAGQFMAESGSIKDVIEGTNQYQPFREGKLKRGLTEGERARAMKALEMARDEASLRANLEASGMDASGINNIMASTGFRTHSARYDASQDVNPTRLGGHQFNTAGNAKMLTPGAKVETAPASPQQHTVPLSEMPDENSSPEEWAAHFRRVDAMGARPPATPSPPGAKPKPTVDMLRLLTAPPNTNQEPEFTPPSFSTPVGRSSPLQPGS